MRERKESEGEREKEGREERDREEEKGREGGRYCVIQDVPSYPGLNK